MQLEHNISLKGFNSFGIDSTAKNYVVIKSIEDIEELSERFQDLIIDKHLILGGGSNLLFTKPIIEQIVIKNEIKGCQLIREDLNHYYVEVASGENWHRFVLFCIKNSWAGIENLSLIPGTAGAAPIQNIGAYGVEIKDLIETVEAYHIGDKTFHTFKNIECNFEYRESIFKSKYKGQFIITKLVLKLNKIPILKTNYGAIESELVKRGIEQPTIQNISDAIIHIRSSKLPDPNQIGNAGSFFKNPSISKFQFQELKTKFPLIQGFNNQDGTIKIPAGWLIETAGWKGYRDGDAGCHALQALVLVNYGKAEGLEILALSEKIIQSIYQKFGIKLEREVNII